MGGGWVGYVYAIFGCGGLLVLVAGSTAVLYAYERVKRRARPEPRALVQSVSSRDEGA